MMYSSDMCLGRNAKRIGDILKSMGDEKASREAYESAEGYYKKALKELEPDTGEHKLVLEEMAMIPTGK